ncbi:hypothetical protein CVIRNUC_000838 [Coccomyxa viridis]|uniref:SHSP domain-containing protein n=1 Tax=Coccomyxa viridis TaxID=1274662 RepID=A0AAV1HT04_9CHLO|nr:hypothetical protein CVIRNUC_000838 [Coccomyxa viridis]
MIPESAARRVACLAGHVTQGQEHATSLTHQDCAAKHTLQYARACSHVDLKYARPAQPQAHQVQIEKTALEFAEHTLWALQKGSNTQKKLQDPPLYARPAPDAPQQQAPALQPKAPKALSKIPKLTAARTFAPRLTAGWAPKVDAIETASHYQLHVALPGIPKENLRVELWGPFLTVSGTRKGGAMGMRDPARRGAGGKGVILRREMDYGFFSASWRLPANGSLDSLYAEHVDGILRISMRKKGASKR